MNITGFSNANSKDAVSILGFTEGQLKAYKGLLDFIHSDYNPNDFKRALVGPAGTGKALLNGTPVLTDDGWKPIESLKVGDFVSTPYNGFTKVVGVYHHTNRPLYRINFKDGRTIVTDEDHLWMVRNKKQITAYRKLFSKTNTSMSSVKSTLELYNDLNNSNRNSHESYKYKIPIAKIEYKESSLVIPPYALGVLLGDGCLTNNLTKTSESECLYISSDEKDIIERVANLLNCSYRWHKDYNYTNTLYGDSLKEINNYLHSNNLHCLASHKYIPKEYILNSIENRIELLKGLIDTDGHIDKLKGRIRYSTISTRLKDDFISLCRSLGYECGVSVDRRGKNLCYDISISTNDVIFSSNKHIKNYNNVKVKYTEHNDHVAISSIIKLNRTGDTTCIAVEDKDELFVTKDYIITHNTYLLKAVIKNCNTSYSLIGLAAPTHKACRVLNENVRIPNVKINTLQSDLGLKLNFDVEKFDIKNPPFDPKGRIKIGDFKIYIIDEASMINRGLLMFLEKICKQNQCKIIYVGDSSQLAPVNEKYSAAFRGIITYTLTEIVRQGDDNPVSNLLPMLRYDIEHKSYTFLNYIIQHREVFNEDFTKGYKVCNAQEFQQIVYNNFNDEELSRNVDFAKVIAYTNVCVSSWNKYIRNAIIKDSNKSIITKNDLIISYTTIVNKFNDAVIKNSEEYIINDIVNYVHPQYGLKGFMIKFQAIHGGQIATPLFVIDHSDKFSIQMYAKLSQDLVTAAKNARANMRAQRWKDYYTFKESCLLLTNILGSDGRTLVYSRDLDYGFALTSHKS